MLLAVVGHKDDIAVGGPDEAGELQVVLGARGRRLHGRNLVGLNAAELRGRVQHPNAAQQTGVHLRRTRETWSCRELNQVHLPLVISVNHRLHDPSFEMEFIVGLEITQSYWIDNEYKWCSLIWHWHYYHHTEAFSHLYPLYSVGTQTFSKYKQFLYRKWVAKHFELHQQFLLVMERLNPLRKPRV